jgi:RNA polymerase sigma-70 factor (ECF subfamily)
MADTQEIAIIDEVIDGQKDHYRFLVDRYHKGLIQHLYALTGNLQTSEDIAQEAFIKAYDKLSQYDKNYAFSTWLYKIADNLAFRNLKQLKNTQDIDEIAELVPDHSPTPAEQVDKLFTKEAVQKSVEGLPMSYRRVISLYYWDDFSYEEIAIIMDTPIGTIRTWLYRAKEQLRKELYGQI